MSNNFDTPIILDSAADYFGFGRTQPNDFSDFSRIHFTTGDPNGVIVAPLGSLALRGVGVNELWQNTDGISAWALVGGGGTIIVEDEGVPIPGGPHTTLNFVGAGVTAADAGAGVADVTIPGGAAADVYTPGIGSALEFWIDSTAVSDATVRTFATIALAIAWIEANMAPTDPAILWLAPGQTHAAAVPTTHASIVYQGKQTPPGTQAVDYPMARLDFAADTPFTPPAGVNYEIVFSQLYILSSGPQATLTFSNAPVRDCQVSFGDCVFESIDIEWDRSNADLTESRMAFTRCMTAINASGSGGFPVGLFRVLVIDPTGVSSSNPVFEFDSCHFESAFFGPCFIGQDPGLPTAVNSGTHFTMRDCYFFVQAGVGDIVFGNGFDLGSWTIRNTTVEVLADGGACFLWDDAPSGAGAGGISIDLKDFKVLSDDGTFGGGTGRVEWLTVASGTSGLFYDYGNFGAPEGAIHIHRISDDAVSQQVLPDTAPIGTIGQVGYQGLSTTIASYVKQGTIGFGFGAESDLNWLGVSGKITGRIAQNNSQVPVVWDNNASRTAWRLPTVAAVAGVIRYNVKLRTFYYATGAARACSIEQEYSVERSAVGTVTITVGGASAPAVNYNSLGFVPIVTLTPAGVGIPEFTVVSDTTPGGAGIPIHTVCRMTIERVLA